MQAKQFSNIYLADLFCLQPSETDESRQLPDTAEKPGNLHYGISTLTLSVGAGGPGNCRAYQDYEARRTQLQVYCGEAFARPYSTLWYNYLNSVYRSGRTRRLC